MSDTSIPLDIDGPPNINAVDVISALFLGAATLLIVVQVILRTFFSGSVAWTEELGRYLFIWAVFLGTLASTVRMSHIRVTFLIERYGPRAEWWSVLFGHVVSFLSYGFVAWFGWQYAWAKRNVEFYTLPGAPQVFLYVSLPLCMTAVIIVLGWQIARYKNYKAGV